jgi:5'-deoxynucleotidase YfbR-like HD superfamily hydrolase
LLDFLTMVGRCKVEKRTGWVNSGVPAAESVADHQWRMAIMALACADYAALPSGGREDLCTYCGSPSSSSRSNSSNNNVVSPSRAVRMALVHDLAESLVSDITPEQFSGVTKAQKHRLESDAMTRIVDTLHKAHQQRSGSSAAAQSQGSAVVFDVAAEVRALWEEYEAGATATAQFVKQLDKVEMYLQAAEYQAAALAEDTPEGRERKQRLERFFDGMPSQRAKADVVNGDAPQRMLAAVMDELQRRRVQQQQLQPQQQ